jgi:asparagine synthase (glutamine-hydrolysing)
MDMTVSLKVRTQVLDWQIKESAFRSRGHTKLPQGGKKHWFKRVAASLNDGDLTYRIKQMFNELMIDWLHNHARSRQTLDDSALLSELFERARIEADPDARRDDSANDTRELPVALWSQGEGGNAYRDSAA